MVNKIAEKQSRGGKQKLTNSADNTINREKKTNRLREVVDRQTDIQ